MLNRKTLRTIHLAGTVWFIVCVSFILVLALLQAGVKWWVVFSLSGHGVLIIFLLVSLYLFVIFKGIRSSQTVQAEHPLTSTTYYMVFYVTTPFLGALAGCLGYLGIATGIQFLLGVALGTFVATFLVWVIVDPVAGVLEVMLLPASRRSRAERLALAKAQREKQQRDRERLLEEILEKEESQKRHWREVLKGEAEKLAGLLTVDVTDFKQAEREAVDIGANAWQIGGLGCMQQLHEMAIDICRQRNKNKDVVDYIGLWWDGIGSWRNPSLHKAANP